MAEKGEMSEPQVDRGLTSSEIRARVEGIAEELASRIRLEQGPAGMDDLEAYPVDTRRFVMMMSEFVRMN